MQSSDIFTVGGSLSVNAHGMDHKVGSIASTVKSLTIMMADETIRTLTPEDDPELLYLIIGGYGLFGIILTTELEITDNVMYKQEIKIMKAKKFPKYFDKIMRDDTYDLFYAHASTSPVTFFKNIITYGYKKIETHTGPFPELHNVTFSKLRNLLLNLAKVSWAGKIAKWVAEKRLNPLVTKLLNNTHVSRNEVMHDSVEYLKNTVAHTTDILQEYFVPKDKLLPCLKRMGRLLKNYKAIVLNASIRSVHKEPIFLNYAPQDMFAIVLYLNQRTTPKALAKMKELTQKLIDLVLELKGTFFLPYQLYFTKKQLRAAYPNIDAFFEKKREYDPECIFMNNFYAKYIYAKYSDNLSSKLI